MQILWFRQDIRVHDNPALDFFLEQKKTGDKAIYFLTPEQWQTFGWAEIKIDFIKRHVQLLEQQLSALGISLTVIEVANFNAQVDYFATLKESLGDFTLITNQELELNERQRDIEIEQLGIEIKHFECDVIVPKGKVTNQSGEMYKVFTPFKNAWLKYVQAQGFDCSINHVNVEASLESACSGIKVDDNNLAHSWPLVTTVIRQVLPSFLSEKFSLYQKQRDYPAIKGTSGLSPYLAIGVLSPRYVLRQIIYHYPDILLAKDQPQFTWLNELIWREFYRHLLHHQPLLIKHLTFKEKYRNTQWPFNSMFFDAWCEGKTGYPLVDAAMRQLNQTGWMHNRLRMVVASFLTKHLLIDWRYGEKYFMSRLIDGDFAANNGGWQWAASTGCDAQPYFRIFNPIRQSEKFDPHGEFIRKYIPELDTVPDKYIHFPHDYLAGTQETNYWPAIVDHKSARQQALNFYQ